MYGNEQTGPKYREPWGRHMKADFFSLISTNLLYLIGIDETSRLTSFLFHNILVIIIYSLVVLYHGQWS